MNNTINKYPLLRSTLEGIFGAQVGLDKAAAEAALRIDLNHGPFKEGIERELNEAMADHQLSLQKLLDECDVAYFETEDEARSFIEHEVLNVVRQGNR